MISRGAAFGLPVGLPNKARNTQKGSPNWPDSKVAERMKIMPSGNESREIKVPKKGPENLDALHPALRGFSGKLFKGAGLVFVVVEVEGISPPKSHPPKKNKVDSEFTKKY